MEKKYTGKKCTLGKKTIQREKQNKRDRRRENLKEEKPEAASAVGVMFVEGIYVVPERM